MVPQNTTPNTPHRLNLSLERATAAHAWLADKRETLAQLSHHTQVMAALGLLICDDQGRFTPSEIDSAMADRDAVFSAECLLREVFA